MAKTARTAKAAKRTKTAQRSARARKAAAPSTARDRAAGKSQAAPASPGKGKLERARLPGQAAKAPRAEASAAAEEVNEGKYVY
jgi:hypothetical protein